MLAHRRDNAASQLASEMLQEGERGLTSVAACMPNLTIAAGFWHSCEEPLRVHPCVFLLDREKKTVADPFRVGSGNITYYVAGTLEDTPGRKSLMLRLQDTARDLSDQGFAVEPISPFLRYFL